MFHSIRQRYRHASVGRAILIIVHMEKAIVLKDTFLVLDDCVREIIVLECEYVEDPEAMPDGKEPLEITMVFPMREKDGVIESAKKYVAELSNIHFAVVQTSSDGVQSVISRGIDTDAASRYAGISVLCKSGEIIDAEALASSLSYECDGFILRVLPYELSFVQSI